MPLNNAAKRDTHGYEGITSVELTEMSDEVKSDRRHTRPHPPKSLARSWWLEILAAVFSLLCLAAVIGILAHENGRPLSSWTSSRYVTPNAVVSFLATISKASFLVALGELVSQLKWIYFEEKPRRLYDLEIFDKASRGPSGSVYLLFSRHKHALLASWAALVMIVAILVDPFVQLVLTFPTVNQDAGPGIGSTFATSLIYDPVAGSFGTSENVNLEPRLQSAILSGVFGTVASPDFACEAPYCQFNDTVALGVCGGCSDITPVVTTTCNTIKTGPFPAEATGPISLDLNNSYTCSYTYPSPEDLAWGTIANLSQLWNPSYSSLNLSSLYGNYKAGEASPLPYYTVWNSSAANAASIFSDGFLVGIPFSFAQFVSVKLPVEVPVNTTQKAYIPPLQQAQACALYPCTRTYQNISVANGTLRYAFGPTATLQPTTQTIAPGDHQPQIQLTAQNGDNTTVEINQSITVAIGGYLQDLMSCSFDTQGTSQLTFPATSDLQITPNIALLLSQSTDIPGMVGRIADAMTEVFRTGPNSTSVQGKAYVETTIISVQWGWLALPIVLVVMTIGLLAAVLLQTGRRHVTSFKSSSLALLFHRLDGWEGDGGVANGYGAAADESVLGDKAKTMMAKLNRNTDRLAFVRS